MDIFDSIKKEASVPEREDPVSLNRAGTFCIPKEYVDTGDPVILALFSRVYIVRAETFYGLNKIQYIGYSDLFERASPGSVAPEYNILINAATVPDHIPEKQHGRWIEQYCATLNEIKDSEIFYARSAIRHHFYHPMAVQSSAEERMYMYYSVKRMEIGNYTNSNTSLPFASTGNVGPDPVSF